MKGANPFNSPSTCEMHHTTTSLQARPKGRSIQLVIVPRHVHPPLEVFLVVKHLRAPPARPARGDVYDGVPPRRVGDDDWRLWRRARRARGVVAEARDEHVALVQVAVVPGHRSAARSISVEEGTYSPVGAAKAGITAAVAAMATATREVQRILNGSLRLRRYEGKSIVDEKTRLQQRHGQ